MKQAPESSPKGTYLEQMQEQFAQAYVDSKSSHTTDALNIYLKKNHTSEIKNLHKIVPTLFHSRWILTSINGHKKNLKRAIKWHKNGNLDKFHKEIKTSSLWLGQAKRIYELIIFMRTLDTSNIAKLFINNSDTCKGDIVLSYKTAEYIRKSNVSRLVKMAGNSAITHVMLVAHSEPNNYQLLHSGDETKGLGLKPTSPQDGELLLVMRLKDPTQISALEIKMNRWIDLALNRNTQKTQYDKLVFSELKCQSASIIGFITVLATYLTIPISLHNPFKNRPGVFCSETVDNILKEAEITIAPRSERDSVVGPVEFFYSPLLEFKGIITHETDTQKIFNEIKNQFK